MKNNLKFNDKDPKNIKKRKEIFKKHLDSNKFSYEDVYNEMMYHSPGRHLGKYLNDIIEYANINEKYLDVGCGCGEMGLLKVKQKGFDVYGFDIVKNSVYYANSIGLENVVIHSASEKFPYENSHFGFVSCVDVLEHLQHNDVKFALSEINRVLKNNRFCFIASSTSQTKDGVHLTILDIRKWIELYEQYGFKYIKKIKKYGVLLKKYK